MNESHPLRKNCLVRDDQGRIWLIESVDRSSGVAHGFPEPRGRVRTTTEIPLGKISEHSRPSQSSREKCLARWQGGNLLAAQPITPILRWMGWAEISSPMARRILAACRIPAPIPTTLHSHLSAGRKLNQEPELPPEVLQAISSARETVLSQG